MNARGGQDSVVVEGRALEFPVPVASASLSGAMVAVPTERVRAVMASAEAGSVLLGAGVEPQAMPGLRSRSMVGVLHIKYHDDPGNVLGDYHEFGIGFRVRLPGGGSAMHIHELPVDQAFTCAAGQRLWGFPKWVAAMAGETGGARSRLDLAAGGEGVLALRIGAPIPGLPVPVTTSFTTVQVAGGNPVLVDGEIRGRRTRSGYGGGLDVRLRDRMGGAASGEPGGEPGGELGGEASVHAERLRQTVVDLGLDSRRALLTFALGELSGSFSAPRPLT